MLPALAVLYALITAADVAITIKAVRLGIAKEINILIRPLVHKPVLFIAIQLELYVAFIGLVVYWHSFRASRSSALVMLAAACVLRGLVVANNVRVLRRKR